jgi:hypothetical protein
MNQIPGSELVTLFLKTWTAPRLRRITHDPATLWGFLAEWESVLKEPSALAIPQLRAVFTGFRAIEIHANLALEHCRQSFLNYRSVLAIPASPDRRAILPTVPDEEKYTILTEDQNRVQAIEDIRVRYVQAWKRVSDGLALSETQTDILRPRSEAVCHLIGERYFNAVTRFVLQAKFLAWRETREVHVTRYDPELSRLVSAAEQAFHRLNQLSLSPGAQDTWGLDHQAVQGMINRVDPENIHALINMQLETRATIMTDDEQEFEQFMTDLHRLCVRVDLHVHIIANIPRIQVTAFRQHSHSTRRALKRLQREALFEAGMASDSISQPFADLTPVHVLGCRVLVDMAWKLGTAWRRLKQHIHDADTLTFHANPPVNDEHAIYRAELRDTALRQLEGEGIWITHLVAELAASWYLVAHGQLRHQPLITDADRAVIDNDMLAIMRRVANELPDAAHWLERLVIRNIHPINSVRMAPIVANQQPAIAAITPYPEYTTSMNAVVQEALDARQAEQEA